MFRKKWVLWGLIILLCVGIFLSVIKFTDNDKRGIIEIFFNIIARLRPVTVVILPEKTHQTIEGFGASVA